DLLERQIERRLPKNISISEGERPLSAVLRELGASAEVPIILDERDMQDASIDAEMLVTPRYTAGTLRNVLRHLLRPIDLTYVIRQGALLVTSRDAASNMLTVKVYPVGDLVEIPGDGNDVDSRREALASTVAPRSWDEVGRPSSISYHPNTHAL